ncbi:GNAT family N-acetyltransferase [Clostridium boliviensis]|uniref:GNAT family N-acetyltransferase n=1 Tax=Clostridium boliviensis TaxID=318465 RepID=A0ABU4GHY7_9CLOT|nr:GNAT family N-acetyltransferase [Clostridium boliviensis]MDW2797229.1 GNAT family N-acetyltransferase [Clostridium boliviensis]
MKIRTVRPEDSDLLIKMLKQLDTETSFMMYEPGERTSTADDMKHRIEHWESSGSLFLLLENEGDLAGFLSASRGEPKRIRHSAYLVIGILKDYRGRGYGTMLFEEMEKWAKESGITRLELTVVSENEQARHLYEKMGFVIEGKKERSMIVDGTAVDEFYMAKLL